MDSGARVHHSFSTSKTLIVIHTWTMVPTTLQDLLISERKTTVCTVILHPAKLLNVW